MAKATKPKTVKGKSKGKGGKKKTSPAPTTETAKKIKILGLPFWVGVPPDPEEFKGG